MKEFIELNFTMTIDPDNLLSQTGVSRLVLGIHYDSWKIGGHGMLEVKRDGSKGDWFFPLTSIHCIRRIADVP